MVLVSGIEFVGVHESRANQSRNLANQHVRNLTHIFPSSLETQVSGSRCSYSYRRPSEQQLFQTHTSLESLRVLIAEDNEINRKVLTRLLNRIGVDNITAVDNGAKAIEMEAAHRILMSF